MQSLAIIAVLLSLMIVSTGLAADLPNPYQVKAEPWIGPAPVPLMEQVFWVQLNVPPGTELKVMPPEGVTLLD